MDDSGETVSDPAVAQLEAAMQFAPVPMAATDLAGRLLGANQPWYELTGVDPADPHRATWHEVLDAADRRRLRDALERAAREDEISMVEAQLLREPSPRWTRWWMQRRRLGPYELVVMATIDFHDEVAQRDDLRALATHDDLTGLVNRRFFVETVDQALRRAERFMEPACVLYVDLDGFKEVNDQAGHSTGDRVLKAVAARLKLAVRAADVVARIGGDEFAVLIERLHGPDDAGIVARRITQALNGPVEVAGRGWPISGSVGLALSLTDQDSAADLLARADQSMYAAKRTQSAPVPVPEPAAVPAAAPAPAAAPPPVPAIDLRSLQDRMDQIRRSLDELVRELGGVD
jgi:diguanylate cyclase (GGDEF)-like protein